MKTSKKAPGSATVPVARQKEEAGRQKAERACLRCGCTEQRACGLGCSWVHSSDVCDSCLSPGEELVHTELQLALVNANTNQLRTRAINRLETFARYLNESSADMPIPYVPVKGGAKLAISATVQDHAYKVGCGYHGVPAFNKRHGLNHETAKYPKPLGSLCRLSVAQGGCKIKTCGRNK